MAGRRRWIGRITRRAVKPFATTRVSSLDLDLRQAAWPARRLGALEAHMKIGERGKLDVSGGMKEGVGWLEIVAEKIALTPFNPYATT